MVGGSGQWAKFGWRVLLGLAHLLLPVPSSFLITCPSHLPPSPQVPVSQIPATVMPNAR